MRVASEAIDDRFVTQLEVIVVPRRERAEQWLCLHMDQLGFAVHVWQEHENAFGRRELTVRLCSDRFLRQDERNGVLRERLRSVAVDISRELVQHDDLGEAALWSGAPLIQLTSA